MQAIRLYMLAAPDATINEAKEEVESMLTGLYVEDMGARSHKEIETPHGNPFTSRDSIMTGVSYVDRLQIAEALFEGNKIEAINIFKSISPGTDLAKAKRIIELYEQELYASYPSRFSKPRSKKKKLNPIVAILLTAAVIVLIIVAVYILILWK